MYLDNTSLSLRKPTGLTRTDWGSPRGSPVVFLLVHVPVYISATAGFTLAFFLAASGRYLGWRVWGEARIEGSERNIILGCGPNL